MKEELNKIYYLHKCACGCGNSIELKPHHDRIGIPVFNHGHNRGVIGIEQKISQNIFFCCKDCGGLIKYANALKGTGLCYSCANKGNKNPQWSGGTKYTKCLDCGKKILLKAKTNRCLSHSIKLGFKLGTRNSKGQNNGMFGKRGKNNPNWKNARPSSYYYTIEFDNNLKLKIRIRDHFTCQNPNCNISEKEHLEKYGRVLTIHHIDYDKTNCNELNLITTCVACNSKANFNRDYWFSFYTYIIKNQL